MPDQPVQDNGKNPGKEKQFASKNSRRKFVNIGSLQGRWMKIKSKKGCKTDEDFARLLIKSLHLLDKQRHYGGHTFRPWKRSYLQGSQRIVILQNDVWVQWKELKCSLQVKTNSQLATVLINAWHDRAAYIKNLFEAQLFVRQDAVNEKVVGHSSAEDQSDTVTSEPVTKMTAETPYHSDETECVNEESKVDSNLDSEIDDLMNYLQTEKKMIKITEDPTGNNEILGNRRKSSRVQSRGYRPDYASLDWIGNANDSKRDTYISKNLRQVTPKQTRIRGRGKSSKETYLTGDDEFTDDTENVKINKRKVKEDPDFVVSDINDAKDLDESDENFERGEGECSSHTDKTGKVKNSRKSQIGSPGGKNYKRKRRKKEDSEWFEQFEKKPKVKKETKRRESSEQQAEKKPWIHIKLEEHQDKYRMEIVGSFARKNRNVDITEELFKCLMCGRFKSTAKDIFEEHIEKHVNRVLECDQCAYVGRSEMEVVKHKMSSGHVSRGHHYMCDICGLVLYTWDSRLSHMGKEHDCPQFQCRYCDEKLVTRAKRQLHQRTVHSDQVKYCFSCETDCGTLSLDDFRDHQNSCKVGHQCQVCGVILASKSGLSNHIKSIHMNVRMYQCSTCAYAGKSAQRLREHEMTHNSVHPYSCDKCTFTCVQAYQLKSHMRTHNGEKPYKCSQCKFAAAWNVQLKEHTKVHELENAVVCLYCDIVFRNQKALKMHEKKDHPLFPVTH